MTEQIQDIDNNARLGDEVVNVSARHPESRLDADQLFLYQQLPPKQWQSGAYRYKTSFWLNIHADIRQHQQRLYDVSTMYQTGDLTWTVYRTQIMPLIHQYIFKLHQHHNIEDQGYFPHFIDRYPQLQSGFEILDDDHVRLDARLNDLQALNEQLASSQTQDADLAKQLHQVLIDTSELLLQHLSDEEDLVIPILGLNESVETF